MPRPRVGVTGGVPTVLGGHRGGVLARRGPRVPRGKRNPGRRVRPSRGWPKPRPNPARGSSGCGSPRRALRAEGQLRPGYLLLREKKFSSGVRDENPTSGVKREPVGAPRPGLLHSPSGLGWRICFFIFGSRPPQPSKSRNHAPPAFRESESPCFYGLNPQLDRVISAGQENPTNEPRVSPLRPFPSALTSRGIKGKQTLQSPEVKSRTQAKPPRSLHCSN